MSTANPLSKAPAFGALINVDQFAELLGISRRSIFRERQRDPRFPKGVKLGKRSVRWALSDVQTYVDALRAAP